MVVTSVVVCVQQSLATASNVIYSAIATWMTPIVGAMFTLAVALMGMRMAGGEQGAIRQGVPLVIKLGMIAGYTYFLGSVGALAFNIMALLATAGGGGATPWGMVDNIIMSVMGYGPTLKIYEGLIGLITASLFSGTIGVAVFIAGIMGITSLISCIGRIIFVYLGAFTVVAFMVALSPLFIPMLVFNATDRYFRQWVNITVAAMIQPMFLFAVCSMFLSVFPALLGNILSVTGGNDFRAIWRWNKPMSSWLAPSDPKLHNFVDELDNEGEPRKRVAAQPTYMNPLFSEAPELNIYKFPSIDFGLVHVQKMQQLLMAFVAFALFAMLMKTLVEITPQIAEDITAASIGLAGMKTSIEQQANQAVGNAGSSVAKGLGEALEPAKKEAAAATGARAAPSGGGITAGKSK